MALLIAGVVFWSITHLFPAAAPGVRAGLARKLGDGPYKGIFALDIVLALFLIIYGWKTAVPTMLYSPPLIGSPIPGLLMVLAIVLFVMSAVPNNLRRFVRHPQMIAVIFWGISHLLSNGDSRSVVLFGGLSIWALMEMLFINKRDGEWQRPATVAFVKDVATGVVAIAVFVAIVYFHAALFGVPAVSNV
jgi:uncharacterized membrane protein